MHFGRHISGQFNVELESIRTHVLTMGGLVEQQLSYAIQALNKEDIELARKVVRDDHKVNAMEVSIDDACTRIIAKRQPTAKDLRLIMAIIKTITDLERIGDVATRIAYVAIESPSSKERQFQVSLEPLCRQAIQMLHQVLDAFARMDVEAAAEVHKQDDKLDAEYEAVIRQLMTYMMEDPKNIPHILQVMWSARAIERVGDRCQNICEYIIYFVKGKDVRHLGDQSIDDVLK
ncbi:MULTISPECIES: phosphate signaling complex protein PhoU [Vibrio]|jgi:phosphate transport system protein|uniref:Phosphate-specific transport system accessory protein PhoU n=1 Tax=Vibrio natriegens NBRC 15636 = ATCC 14048 = DSM 759 TaxID=1219067 RepID=A0AAN0Y0U1_VIBNA|nr:MULTISPECIES: phosphate signaling complex protein PhoU [Vibrio]MBR9875207.1 phosphate signaling complex protein PhoU [Vibrionaceae bacterium]MEE3880408.1 phosphate signaling complex protein PhoU [Vibrio sp. YYF0003]AEX21026.1 transcriptional regulator PhoU [Vibrio sp. EJY3]ALR16395.1 transcriptional regulator PhoU [Vibrio natriegens NBRC 15636 = ATCC 14048 = DSM 759]ANQ11741.1 phosphate transport system regulatory protein PhoU [Vibrio natriegens NBRC 15636 = ATCC 14048 = DSM 759]